ncbi:DNA mismatch repair endonuclease MutL [Synechocystis sp. LKSZ1]|uniref:DNA mismatch repair endonuclease MutL n=1 Tax=Synechocystis sp. LKSZ1 TaxID=3144951 RepID=UPI00336BFDF4
MIYTLPDELVRLIAAGEVIDSLVAVVRELVENALDAGATRLTIHLDPDHWQVQVIDNGQGLSKEDLQACAHPHSTSKLQALTDLTQVQSLGFRGEALHSLAQVAQLEITSRLHQPGALGWQARYDHQGQVISLGPTAMAPGTVVTVKELFANLPQRRQAGLSHQPQLKALQHYLQTLALVHPHLTWQVWQTSRLLLSLSPGTSARQILPQFLKSVKPSDLQDSQHCLELPTESAQQGQIYLLFGLPDRCHRHRPDWIKVALNGRPIHCPELEQATLGAFHRTLPQHRFPLCFLHLQVPPAHVDWNRNPSKTEVYLQDLRFWQTQVSQILQQDLQHILTGPWPQQRLNQLLKAQEAQPRYQLNPLEQSLTTALAPLTVKAVAQVHQTYIVAEHTSGLWLVEQHIAHERILYERLQADWQAVPLPQPMLLQRLREAQVEQLQHLGLEVDPFGEDIWAIRSIPQLLIQAPEAMEILWEMSLGGDLATAQATLACRTALKNGTPLTLGEMQSLLDQWCATRHPQTCPHGRPIYLALEESSLARFFRRNWLIDRT